MISSSIKEHGFYKSLKFFPLVVAGLGALLNRFLEGELHK